MCLGAIYWARPARVVFAATRQDAAAYGFDDQFIYNQLELPLAKRKIPFHHLTLPEADALFNAWMSKEDKTSY
jgi:tRNA(Arg) A34 adenosine deaminase TadA